MSKYQMLVDQATEHLEPGERFIAAVMGICQTKDNDRASKGLLIATDRRVVFYAKTMIGYQIWSFPYSNISSIEQGKSWLGQSVTVYASGNKIHVRSIKDAEQLAGFMDGVHSTWHRDLKASGPTSVAEELAKLAELRDQGVIDAADWNRAKDLYLGKTEDERDRAARELKQIHDLQRSGVLSEMEFNMKKWDILSRTS